MLRPDPSRDPSSHPLHDPLGHPLTDELSLRIAAVIPHFNRRDLLENLLQSMATQARPFDEIIVVDNGSTDGSQEVAARGGARLLALGENLGFAAAVNRGVALSNADCVAILNNDVTLDPGWLQQLAKSFASPDVHFATGKTLNASDPHLIDGTFDEVSAAACAYRCGAGKQDAPIWNQTGQIRIAPMTAAVFRRALWDEIGGLDEAFGSYLEDVDFGIRCALAGRAGFYVPAGVAYHRGSATWGRWHSDTVFYLARNQILLAQKHFRGLWVWPKVAGQLLWGMVALRHGCGWSYLRGKTAGLRKVWAAPTVSDSEYSTRQAANRVRELVDASERNMRLLGRETGLDRYWRAYFWLSGR